MTALTLKSPVLESLTDEEFYQFCADNRDWRIERDANRQIYSTPPANSETGKSNNELSRQLANWNVETDLGETFDSSSGFTLDTGATLSPDTCWIARDRWDALSPEDRRGFARICPNFVAEQLSPTDRLKDTMRKMEHWLEAGAKLGWLIAPGTESVYIFEPGQPVRPVVGFDQDLVAGPLLPGFRLELRRLRMK
jgi:Uma2 family endonuclease